MHILHLEDDGPLREILKVAMTAADPNITMPQFSRAEPALEYIEQNKQTIDVFILDIRLPGTIDGIQVANKIRELGCEGAIVITSAFIRPNEDTLKGLNCVWLSKPWHILDAPAKIFELVKNKPRRVPAAPSRVEAPVPTVPVQAVVEPPVEVTPPPAVEAAPPPRPKTAPLVAHQEVLSSQEDPAPLVYPEVAPMATPQDVLPPQENATPPVRPKSAPMAVLPPQDNAAPPTRPKTAPLGKPPSDTPLP